MRRSAAQAALVALVVSCAGASPPAGPLAFHARAAAAVALAIAGLESPVTPAPGPQPPPRPSPDGACPSACDCADGWIGDRSHRSPCPCAATCRCKSKRGPADPTPPTPAKPRGGDDDRGVYQPGGAPRKCAACLGTRHVMGSDGVVRRCTMCPCDGERCQR